MYRLSRRGGRSHACRLPRGRGSISTCASTEGRLAGVCSPRKTTKPCPSKSVSARLKKSTPTSRDGCRRRMRRIPESDSGRPPYAQGFSSLGLEVHLEDLPVTGHFPAWLMGTLVRNGPGRFEVGTESFRHW